MCDVLYTSCNLHFTLGSARLMAHLSPPHITLSYSSQAIQHTFREHITWWKYDQSLDKISLMLNTVTKRKLKQITVTDRERLTLIAPNLSAYHINASKKLRQRDYLYVCSVFSLFPQSTAFHYSVADFYSWLAGPKVTERHKTALLAQAF